MNIEDKYLDEARLKPISYYRKKHAEYQKMKNEVENSSAALVDNIDDIFVSIEKITKNSEYAKYSKDWSSDIKKIQDILKNMLSWVPSAKSNRKKKRVVMMVGTMPEDNYADSEVTEVGPNETDKEAINRAKKMYSQKDEFYIEEL